MTVVGSADDFYLAWEFDFSLQLKVGEMIFMNIDDRIAMRLVDGIAKVITGIKCFYICLQTNQYEDGCCGEKESK